MLNPVKLTPLQPRASIQQALGAATQQISYDISDSARLDAEILLAFCIEKNRTWLRTWPEKLLTREQQEHFSTLIERRCTGEPIAYLTGRRDFWKHSFQVNPEVLIPRPETELLIEICLQHLPANQTVNILELGTGSGAIAVSLASERPNAHIIATDLSPTALSIAQQNAQAVAVNNIQFIQSDWFDHVTALDFDLIVSNPPYIPDKDPHLEQGDIRFEPDLALASGADGLHDIRKIAQLAPRFLKKNGILALEHGYDQAAEVAALLTSQYHCIENFRDLANNPRVSIACAN